MSTNLLSHLSRREQIIKNIRSYLDKRDFHEVFPTLLNKSLPLEPNLYAYETTGHQYLPTSPESYLKKYLALTSHPCYCISPSFRALEVDTSLHYPEFFLLEIYEPGADYTQIMTLVQSLILSLAPTKFAKNWTTHSLIDLFLTHTHLDLNNLINDSAMQAAAEQLGYKIDNATWEQLFNQIFLNEIEPHLPKSPFFLTDYPARISPLAAPQKDHPNFAQRFELFINRVEIANGNTENTNVKQVRQSMETEKIYRQTHNLPLPPIDESFLKSLARLPAPTAGVGLGLDRLAMLLNNEVELPPSLS